MAANILHLITFSRVKFVPQCAPLRQSFWGSAMNVSFVFDHNEILLNLLARYDMVEEWLENCLLITKNNVGPIMPCLLEPSITLGRKN